MPMLWRIGLRPVTGLRRPAFRWKLRRPSRNTRLLNHRLEASIRCQAGCLTSVSLRALLLFPLRTEGLFLLVHVAVVAHEIDERIHIALAQQRVLGLHAVVAAVRA